MVRVGHDPRLEVLYNLVEVLRRERQSPGLEQIPLILSLPPTQFFLA